jgi:type I restriction-modification system DNA methylase subunit
MSQKKLRLRPSLISPKALEEAAGRFKSRPADWAQRFDAAKRWATAYSRTDIEHTKEKSVQATFLHRIFVDVLGYLDQGGAPAGTWTLIAEPTTDINSRQADGSVGFFTPTGRRVRGIIELKDALTDLDAKQLSRQDRLSPVEQAFLYLASFEEAEFVFLSNFQTLRLYSRRFGMTRYQEFQTSEVHRPDELAKFLAACSAEVVLGATPGTVAPIEQLISTQRIRAQQEITRDFYEKYKAYRDRLVHFIASNYPDLRSEAVTHAQKLLDRLLFILYAEDVGLLPTDIAGRTIRHGKQSRSRSQTKIWEEFRFLFEDIDKGREDLDPPINKYDGGLFALDPVLDSRIQIPNEMLLDLESLSEFDFKSEVDVNILGHVFELSIADVEILRRELALTSYSVERILEAADQRRKDLGVYYTPSWVTHYIVDQTLGRVLQRNRSEDRFSTSILDPSCGSGAFLSEVLSYLSDYSRSLKASALSQVLDPLFEDDVQVRPEDHLNQIYGLDLLPEAVEISRLSLWLKSASPSRPLGNVQNVVTGNTLVPPEDSMGILGTPLMQRLASGGFDVVVTNPPWGAKVDYPLNPALTLARGQYDTYELFLEVALSELCSPDGFVGFVIPDRILRPEGERLRRWLFDNFSVLTVIKVGEGVFSDVYRAAVILIVQNRRPDVSDQYTGLIITKQDRRELDRAGSARLATLVEQRGGLVASARVKGDPHYSISLFPDVDLAIADSMCSGSSPWTGEGGVFGTYGRGEELGRDSFIVQCPSCFSWSINPRARARRRGGGFEPKVCPDCGLKFPVEDALRRNDLVEPFYKPSPKQVPMYSGEEVNRYWTSEPVGLITSVPGFSYKSLDLYEPPKLLIRQTGIGIYSTVDYTEARASQSVYVYRLSEKEQCSIEFYLAQLNSRAMLFCYLVLTSQTEWQSFPKLTHTTLHRLPLRRIDIGIDMERRRHDRIVELVKERMRLAELDEDRGISSDALSIDEEIETLVMDVFGLTPDQRARINKRLQPAQNIRIVRELYPAKA